MLIKCIDAVVFHCKPQERADFNYFAYLHSFFEKNTIMMTHRLFSSTNRSSYNLFHSISSKQTKTVKLRSFRFKPIKKKKTENMSVETNNGEPSLNQIWYPLFEANHLQNFSRNVLFWRIVLPILLND